MLPAARFYHSSRNESGAFSVTGMVEILCNRFQEEVGSALDLRASLRGVLFASLWGLLRTIRRAADTSVWSLARSRRMDASYKPGSRVRICVDLCRSLTSTGGWLVSMFMRGLSPTYLARHYDQLDATLDSRDTNQAVSHIMLGLGNPSALFSRFRAMHATVNELTMLCRRDISKDWAFVCCSF